MSPIRSILVTALLLVTQQATAHFPWIYVTDESYPRLYFNESLAERDYHLPETIAAAEVRQDAIDAPAKLLTMGELDDEGYVGLEGDSPIEPRGRVSTTVVYGNYHGSKLVYYAQHFPAASPESWPQEPKESDGLQALMGVDGDRLVVTVMRDGEPLAGATATLTNEEGGEGVSAPTGPKGDARLPLDAVVDGLNGVMVMVKDDTDQGEVNGEPYKSATHILTATFNYDREAAAKVSALPALPEAVASFGAAVSDGWLYVYGGHIGQAHDHSRDNLSKHFRRIRLDGEGGWEELPMGAPLQGLPLVAHGGKLYRVGGLDARNASGEEEQLHSVDQFAAYDPETGAWTEMPALPGPRSSHNAVVVGDTLYVVGGWALSGDSEGDWQSGAIAFNLSDPEAQWVELADPPFKRRALAVSHVDGKVAVLCGMTDDADLSKQVFLYDPATQAWTEGPEFPGKAFHGFGLSAWNLDGVLYAGGMEGVLYRLSSDLSAWEKADEFATRRFFHQLVPDGRGGLLAVAGASTHVGHTGTIERLDLVFTQEEMSSDSDES